MFDRGVIKPLAQIALAVFLSARGKTPLIGVSSAIKAQALESDRSVVEGFFDYCELETNEGN